MGLRRVGRCASGPGLETLGGTGLHMPAFTHHIFVCGNVRPPGHKRGCCDPEGKQALREAFKQELKKAGFGPLTRANHAGCLEQCEHGPTVVIYPQGVWYGRVTIDDVPRIVSKTLIQGEILDDLVILESCLNNASCPHRRAIERG
jgi:(2Fe-2S) ferredoxin